MPQPTSDVDAEKGFLSCCVKGETEPLMVGLEKLKDAHFSNPTCRALWQLMGKMDTENLDDLAVALEYATTTEERNEAIAILSCTDTSVQWKRYLEALERAHARTILKNMAHETLDGLFEDDTDMLAAQAEARLSSLQGNEESTLFSGEAVAMRGRQSLADRANGEGGVTIGVPPVDSITRGFRKGELVVLSARPSVGKTAFALNMLRSLSVDRAQNVLFFSLEMGVASLGERLVSMTSKVPVQLILDQCMTSDQLSRYDQGVTRVASSQFWVDERSDSSVAQIRARSRRLKAAYGLDMVIIDYLQLVKPADKNQPREQQIATMSREFKGLAKDLDIPVVLLAQLNRESEKSARAPRLSDLRESGAIEQDADIVLFLHRPDPEQRANLQCIVAKNRCGATGDTGLHFTAATQRFSEITNQ